MEPTRGLFGQLLITLAIFRPVASPEIERKAYTAKSVACPPPVKIFRWRRTNTDKSIGFNLIAVVSLSSPSVASDALRPASTRAARSGTTGEDAMDRRFAIGNSGNILSGSSRFDLSCNFGFGTNTASTLCGNTAWQSPPCTNRTDTAVIFSCAHGSAPDSLVLEAPAKCAVLARPPPCPARALDPLRSRARQ